MLNNIKIDAIGIIISNAITLFLIIPRWLYKIIGFISTIATFISVFFDYKKANYSNLIHSINFYNIAIIILCAIIVLLFLGFLYYIIESDDFFRFTLEQKNRQALFLNDNIIPNLMCELENYAIIKQCNITNEYFYTTGMKLINSKSIEITAKSNGFSINKRMTFQVMKRKSIEDIFAYDPLGLAIVYDVSPNSFKSVLIDTNPCESYWKNNLKYLQKHDLEHNDIYLKVSVPDSVEFLSADNLNEIFNQLKLLRGKT